MGNEKDPLPSDAEEGSLKLQKPEDRKPPTDPSEDGKSEGDPSEQPS